MSVYSLILDENAKERFIGIFTTLEKANEAMFFHSYGCLKIRKIDVDKVYFTPINDYGGKSETNLGKHVVTVECNYNRTIISDKIRAMLHKDNDLDAFLEKSKEYEDEGED